MKELVETCVLPEGIKDVRLSDLNPSLFKSIQSKSALKKLIRKALIEVNGEEGKSSKYISSGDSISIFKDDNRKASAQIELKLEVLYEDEYLAVINKAAGILVSGNKRRTLENALQFNLKKSENEDALDYPEAIHRLDFATSGVLLIGKTQSAVVELNKSFEERSVGKKYIAVCIGEFEEEQKTINSTIDGKDAESSYRLLKSKPSNKFGALNLLEIDLFTGRHNQIRIQLSELGNPIYGDNKFAREGMEFKGIGLFLHAHELSLIHPKSQERIVVSAPVPKKFTKLFD